MQGGVRTVEVVVVEEEREAGSALVTGVVRAGVSPFACESLNEAFGLAIGLRAVRTGEAMLEAQLMAGLGEELGAISGAAVGEDALDGDAMSFVEVDGLMESSQDTGSFLIGEERGKSQAGMIINGDVERLDAGTRIAMRTIAGGADAGLKEAAQLFNIKMKQFARSGPFVAESGRPGRVEGSQAVETVAAEDAGKGSFGDGKNHKDLSVGTTLTAEGEDLIFELGGSFTGLAKRHRGAVIEALREAGGLSAKEPLADGFIGDAKGGSGGTERAANREVMGDQFGSHERGESGISVHSVREVWQWVESGATTNQPDLSRADNVLKHDT